MKEFLAHFRLMQILGEGGMGTVYKAVDTRDGKTVALKVLSRQSLLDEEIKRRFLREASAGARLMHPNIVKIYEVGEEEGEHFISMELVEGRTLQQVLKQGPVNAAEVVKIGIAVGEALREAHKTGIVHRDIKAANIMVTAVGQVKVMDFGLAKIQNASMLTREGEMLGTVTYMSPEQATGETVDHRTDIFSLGVVLYELLTGKLPFGDQYDMAVVYSILNRDPVGIRETYPEVPEALEKIVFKALRKDLQHRYQNVEELLGDLRRVKAFLDGKRDIMPSGVELVAGADLDESGPEASHFTGGPRAGFEAKLAGRDEELEKLKSILRKADSGEGHTVFVAGEAGIGKSKLVAELETYARTIKIRPINCRCVFREGNLPYRPFVEAIRDIFTARGLTTAEDMLTYFGTRSPSVIPHLAVLRLFLNVATTESTSLLSKDQLWEAILRLIEAISRERALLFFIDDLQWADEETLRLLQYLSRNTTHMALLILGTYRPEDVSGGKSGRAHPLRDIEQEMLRERCLTVISLERLKEADVRRMISSLFPNAEFGRTFADSVYRESEGNPLFVMEIMKLLKIEGVIQNEAGTYRLRGDFETMSMPSRIQDIVVRRVVRLDRNEREILEIGAVEGEIFHSDTVSHCLESHRLTVLRKLQSLERDYHIIHAQGKVYKFDHAKIREALYDSITPELRNEYHRMIGEFLASTYGDDQQLAPNIAHHFLEGGEEEKALPYLITGGERAQAFFANQQAIHFYEEALRISRAMVRTHPGGVRTQKETVLEGLGDVYSFIGNHDRALENYQELLSATESAPVKRAELLQKMGHVHLSKGDNEKTLATLILAEEALKAADPGAARGPEADSVRGKAAITRARVFKSRGEYNEAIQLIEEGLRALGSEGHLHERADAFNDLGNIFEDRSEYARAEEMFRKSLTLREEIADKRGIAVTYNNLANIFCGQGDYANAAAMLTKSLQLMKEIGFRVGIAGTSNNLSTIYQDQGRYQESLEMNKKCLQVREEMGDRPGIAMSYGNMGFVNLDMGEYGAAKEYLEKSVRLQEEIGMKTLISATISWLGLAYAGLGDIDKGIELALKAVSLGEEMHQKWFEGIAHRSLGSILMKKWLQQSVGERQEDHFEKSLDHLRTSLRIFEEGKFEHEGGRSSLELARLFRHKGDIEQSERYRERSVDVFQKLGAMGDLDRAMALVSPR
jgi:tetratricopeptide (TPR) repeat protein/predicted Ser/Thr protein kinase